MNRSRRSLLALAVVFATACGTSEPTASPPAPSPSAAEPTASSSPFTTPAPEDPEPTAAPPTPPPPPVPWEAGDAETHPELKELAAEVARTLTTYEPDEGATDVAARLAADEGDRDRLARALAPLHHEGSWSRGEVVYPQFGGLTDRRSSQMVVVRQLIGAADGTTREVARTLDLRFRLEDGTWAFEALADAGGTAVPRPDDLPPEAVAVLDDDRIELPDSARWDIHRDAVEPSLLSLMTRLADRVGDYGVLVFESGHPEQVFGTDRRSDHHRGRAVDVHRIGDRLVVEDREEGGDLHALVAWLYDDEVEPNIGSPWALDGFGGRSFTDAVHLDHLHLAVPAPPDRDGSAGEQAADDAERASPPAGA